jgi:hypothetical protein
MYRMMGDLCKMAGSSGRKIEKYYQLAIERAQLQRDNEAERGASIRMRMPEAWNAGRA